MKGLKRLTRLKGLGLGLLGVLTALPALGEQGSNYYVTHDSGWHWYQSSKEDLHLQKKTPSQVSRSDPIQQMKTVQEGVQRALDRAILVPTPENVRAYITLQNQVSQNASHFAAVWKEVLWQQPEMDYTIAHPTTEVARDVYLTEQASQTDAAIQKLASHSGLFFFYRSSCPYCQHFAPLLKRFADHYHFTVIPVTTDGVSLPSFPNSPVDNGQSALFHVTVEPALFTVDPYTHRAIPVSYGLVSEEELKERLHEIAIQEEQHA